MADLSGKVAVITGAAGGIGAAVARAMAAAGARLLLVDRDAAALSALVAEIGPAAEAMTADVTRAEDHAQMGEHLRARYGAPDIAFLNAGTEGQFGPIAEVADAAFDQVMAVNVKGVWLGLKLFMPMMAGRGGSIILTSSIAGLRGAPGWGAYAASKHAVMGLMRSAAVEGAAQGIRVNCVNPGAIATRMIASIDEQMTDDSRPDPGGLRAGKVPMGRYGTPEEVAPLVVFLASDAARYCTGNHYGVDGGVMAGWRSGLCNQAPIR